MAFHKLLRCLPLIFIALLSSNALSPAVHAQVLVASAPLPDAPTSLIESVSPIIIPQPNVDSRHKFWDTQNCILFAAAAVSNGADFAVTRANLQSGGRELNPLVRLFGRSSAGLAMNFAGETAFVISLSYFFHKTGHHKLERAVSVVNVGTSAGAVSFGLTHR